VVGTTVELDVEPSLWPVVVQLPAVDLDVLEWLRDVGVPVQLTVPGALQPGFAVTARAVAAKRRPRDAMPGRPACLASARSTAPTSISCFRADAVSSRSSSAGFSRGASSMNILGSELIRIPFLVVMSSRCGGLPVRWTM
jgi:hypothetical protein